ncbi:hypothetical protein GQ55_1G038300 [Panicum hallii var. hallii]|uniref:Uncharacterized protein n=1 Tax=Panicum hallii var. hallii TaxID=1504633 RepID=A0A2T7F1Z5_9POAL|nr:hypothetical protein GQ55_1G038300 [Panicum hallii var. hallii]
MLQKCVGIFPVKLLLLAFSVARFTIPLHVVDVNCPVNKLLEMLSTCRGRWLKLTSRTRMLLEDSNSSGRPPDSMLLDGFRRSRPVRLPRDARKTSVIVPSELQAIPSHLQQSEAFPHEVLRPPSWESSETNWSKELLSCSVHEASRETKETRITRVVPKQQ